jgi:hypothetical protein
MNTITKPMDAVLNKKIVVTLDRAVQGYWDHGPKSHFEFTATVERTPGPPAIRWGSWGANFWFVVNWKGSAKRHLAAVKRKLQRGTPHRRIEVEDL